MPATVRLNDIVEALDEDLPEGDDEELETAKRTLGSLR